VSLSEWLKNGWLIEHHTSRQEIEHLLQLVDRDLTDCENAITGIELDEMIALAAHLRKSVEEWIATEFPGLRP
jgi:hypothetical protein